MFLDGFHLPHINAPDNQPVVPNTNSINKNNHINVNISNSTYRKDNTKSVGSINGCNATIGGGGGGGGGETEAGSGPDEWIRTQLSQGLSRLQKAWRDTGPLSARLSKALSNSASGNNISSCDPKSGFISSRHSPNVSPATNVSKHLSTVDGHVRKLGNKLTKHRRSLRNLCPNASGNEGGPKTTSGPKGTHRQQVVLNAGRGIDLLKRSLSFNKSNEDARTDTNRCSLMGASERKVSIESRRCRPMSLRIHRVNGTSASSWLSLTASRTAMIMMLLSMFVALCILGGFGIASALPVDRTWSQEDNAGPMLADESQLDARLSLVTGPTSMEMLEELPVKLDDPNQGQRSSANQWLWIQRRRLNRDRALEPSSWMREQPMRRGFGRVGPSSWAADEEGRLGSDGDIEAFRPASRRVERNTAGLNLYEETLRQLLENSPGGRAFLEELYEELEQPLLSGGAGVGAVGMDGSSQVDSSSQRKDQLANSILSDQQRNQMVVVEPESSLVVVSDEPDEGESVAASNSGLKMSPDQIAASVLAVAAANIQERQRSSSQQGFSRSLDAEQQGVPYDRTKARLNAIPTVAQLYEEAALEMAPQDSLQTDSFHVLEEIDREVDPPIPMAEADTRRPQQEVGKLSSAMPSMWSLAGPDETGALSVLPAQKRASLQLRPYAPPSIASMGLEGQTNFLIHQQKQHQQQQQQQQLLPLLMAASLPAAQQPSVSRDGLIRMASLLKVRLERLIGLPKGSILGMYPLNSEQVLIKLDVDLLQPYNMMRMIQDYDYARGYIVATWPTGSQDNPVPLLNAILQRLTGLDQDRDGLPSAGSPDPSPPPPPPPSTYSGDFVTPEVAARLQRYQMAAAYLQAAQSAPSGGSELAIERLLALLEAGRIASGELGLGPEVSSDEDADPLSRSSSLAASSTSLPTSHLGSQLFWQATGSRPNLPSVVCMGLVLLAALLISYLAVKLALGRTSRLLRNHNSSWQAWAGSWRSLWTADSESGDSTSGHLEGVVEGPPQVGKLSDRPTSNSERASQLDQISRRLARLLGGSCSSRSSIDQVNKRSGGCDEELDRLVGPAGSGEVNADEDENGQVGGVRERKIDRKGSRHLSAPEGGDLEMDGGVRTSKSYIKSLVEALSKARTSTSINWSTTSSTTTTTTTNNNDNSPSCLLATAEQTGCFVEKPEVNQKDQTHGAGSDSDQDIVVSQMDISAAHLILAYMEKHLDDKEQLRREWLELNGPMRTSGVDHEASSLKPLQLMLIRQARVALADQNRWKNRNQLVIPFDRNRVRLGAGSGSGSTDRLNPRTGSSGCGDYINASFIHDDEPRQPSHIIAQGPLDRTVGHFWQMVWEQGVSVIVMLTRLNENNAKMCHCYWPTAAAPVAGGDSTTGSANQTGTRRSSVTSVFSTLAHNNGQPIIGNGELANNILQVDTSTSGKEKNISGIKLEVHLVSEHVSSPDYLVRNLYLINKSSGESRAIVQFHYLAWPRGGVPENARSLLQFRRKVHKSYRNLRSPLLIHSSDGSGRAGTFTLIDIILERIKRGAKEIDPRATLEHLRDQRAGVCATQSQFEFVLVALAEEIQMILNALPQ